MSEETFTGRGRKRPQLNILAQNLFLDSMNPRLPADVQGKDEVDLLYALYKFFDIEELAYSMAENGYFDEEPLVAIPNSLPEKYEKKTCQELEADEEYLKFIHDSETTFTVVEGNRRLSTIKILLDKAIQRDLKIFHFPEISDQIRDDLSKLPVIVYPNRKEVLPYLGVRHITGVKKWEPYAKARYIAHMISEGFSMDEVQKMVADRSNSARKFYLCYKLLQEVEEVFDYDSSNAKEEFSYLLLASGQNSIKEFLGLPSNLTQVNYEKPVPAEKEENLLLLFSWLYGEGTKVARVLKESRDITNYLSHVIKSPLALDHLKTTRNLLESYERSGGEEQQLLTYLKKANANLEKSLQFIHRHKANEPVGTELDKSSDTIKTLSGIYNS